MVTCLSGRYSSSHLQAGSFHSQHQHGTLQGDGLTGWLYGVLIDSVQQLHRCEFRCAKPGCHSICCCSCCSDRVPTLADRYADAKTPSKTISVTPVAVGSWGVGSCQYRPHPGREFWTKIQIGAVEAKGLNENAAGEQNAGHCLVPNTTCLGPRQGGLPVLLFDSTH
jgi:hypothetical protein